jgi:hypothetical protein
MIVLTTNVIADDLGGIGEFGDKWIGMSVSWA